MKLEKVEFGGVKGRVLSQLVVNIFMEFQELFKVFADSSYNPLDPEDKVGILFSTFFFTNHLFFTVPTYF